MVETIILNDIETLITLKNELETELNKSDKLLSKASINGNKYRKNYYQGQCDLLHTSLENLNKKIMVLNLQQIYKQQNIEIIIK